MNVVGIRFKEAGKIDYYRSDDTTYNYKDLVIVENDNGQELGEVALVNMEIEADKFKNPLTRVIRLASNEDLEIALENQDAAKEALFICQEKVDDYGLNMKIVDSEYSFDKSKLTFYFTADKRVDFRVLVKDLASIFKSRIELRQIGVRDHAKMIKHYGSCGQQCCCSRHLTDFVPLSIKYAKDQNISLDPTKISGVCGRLMCCLSYEQDDYVEAKKILPNYGQKVVTADGEGIVVQNDYVRCQCKVRVADIESEEMVEKIYNPEEVQVRK